MYDGTARQVGACAPFSDAGFALGLGLVLSLLRKLGNGRVSLIGYFRKHQQVVAPEALRTLPFIAVFVKTRTARMRHYTLPSYLSRLDPCHQRRRR